MITDNGSKYVAARRLIQDHFTHINWPTCAAHCLNLVLKDIPNVDHVAAIVNQASKLTRFVYNHAFWLSWQRKRKEWTEIIHPGETRFGTTFIALSNIYHHKHNLRALITCKDFTDSKLPRDRKTKEVIEIALDKNFWNDCLMMVKIMEPLLRLLKIVDGDKKPSLGYIDDGQERV